jgi:signal transduction histidine kinase
MIRSGSILLLLLLALVALPAQAATVRQVLILHSFARDFAPFNVVAPAFRNELVRLMPGQVLLREASLDIERPPTPDDERAFIEFLRARYRAYPPELVVAVGAPAAHFYLRYRQDLFPGAPLLVTGVERRRVSTMRLEPGDRAAATNIELLRVGENILRLLPETTTLAVIMGSSPLERFWLKEIRKDLAPLAGRVRLVWLTDLTLEGLRERVAALPPGSAVYFAMFVVGADGTPHESGRALAAVSAASTAPVFGAFESELGNGIVGGPFIAIREAGVAAARLAHRLLAGTTPGDSVTVNMTAPVFDWRELRRWRIPESRLPAGGEVRFRPPSVWEQHTGAILSSVALLLLQAALIAGLLVQRARARRAEGKSAALAGRLITAHEDERQRLARELHDDLTQRLARLAIDAAGIERGAGADLPVGIARSMREELVRLSEDVHALSYRLHPSVLDDLGLEAALKAECDRLSRQQRVAVEVDVRELPEPLTRETALCVFRVAQEALRNIARHAHARAVVVSLAGRDGGVQVAVSDDGCGFDLTRRNGASLGQMSMRERVRLLGGELDIESTPGQGTTVVAWVPLRSSAS